MHKFRNSLKILSTEDFLREWEQRRERFEECESDKDMRQESEDIPEPFSNPDPETLKAFLRTDEGKQLAKDPEFLKLKLGDAMGFLCSRAQGSRMAPESRPKRFSYGEMSDLFSMILSKKVFKEVFEPMFEEIKEKHIRLRTKHEQLAMRALIDIAFVLRGIGLIGQCWKAAGLDKLMLKLAAIWGFTRFF